jgi:hypothetical protein
MMRLSVVTMLLVLVAGCDNRQLPMSKDEARALARSGHAVETDLCAAPGWYGDGECDDFCGRLDPDCAAPCAAAGGSCVGVYPGACANGTIVDASCGGGVGVMCCVEEELTPCAAAGGACVGVTPDACAGGTIGEASCGGGVGVMCCMPPTACTADSPIPPTCPVGMCYCGAPVGRDESCCPIIACPRVEAPAACPAVCAADADCAAGEHCDEGFCYGVTG